MRKIDESKITSDKSMFFKQGTWTHLQKAYKEITEETIKSLIGSSYDATKVYVLNGCVNSGSGSSFNISAGSVFYAGEVYLVDATTFTTSGGNVAVGTITTTNNTTDYSADPCLFTDGTYENVHNIRKFVIASGAVGSGTKAYADFNFYPFKNNYTKYTNGVTSAYTTITNQSQLQYNDGRLVTYVNADYTGTIPIDTPIFVAAGFTFVNNDMLSGGVVPALLENKVAGTFTTTFLYFINTAGGVVFSTITALPNTHDKILLTHISHV